MRGLHERPGFTANLNAGRVLLSLCLAVICWIVASPGLHWMWSNDLEPRLPAAALHFDAVVLLAISWALYLLWGQRWGGPALGPLAGWKRLAPWALGLVIVGAVQWYLRDRPLVEQGVQAAPATPAELVALVATVIAFTEVVVRMGWLSLSAGITRSPLRAVAVTALAVAVVDLMTLPAGVEASQAWWVGVYLVTLAREAILCALAYTHGWAVAAVAHAILTLRWAVPLVC